MQLRYKSAVPAPQANVIIKHRRKSPTAAQVVGSMWADYLSAS